MFTAKTSPVTGMHNDCQYNRLPTPGNVHGRLSLLEFIYAFVRDTPDYEKFHDDNLYLNITITTTLTMVLGKLLEC
jgi:hypothetical protein